MKVTDTVAKQEYPAGRRDLQLMGFVVNVPRNPDWNIWSAKQLKHSTLSLMAGIENGWRMAGVRIVKLSRSFVVDSVPDGIKRNVFILQGKSVAETRKHLAG